MNLYVTYYSADFVTKVNLGALTRVGALDLTPGGGGDFTCDCIVIGDNLYIGRDVGPGEIVRVNLHAFAETGRLILPENGVGSGAPHAFAYADDILYVVIHLPGGGVLGGVIRVDVPTFTRIDRLDLAETFPSCPVIDGNYLYVPHSTIAASLRRITLVPFALNATINLTKRYALCSVIEGTNLYIGHSISPAVVTKVDLNTFTETGIVTFNVGENWCWSIVSDGTYLYCGLASAPGNPGVIVRVDIATFTRVDSLILPLAECDVWNLYLHNGFLWALCESMPTNVVKVGPATFTRVDGLQLNPAELDSWAGALWHGARHHHPVLPRNPRLTTKKMSSLP